MEAPEMTVLPRMGRTATPVRMAQTAAAAVVLVATPEQAFVARLVAKVGVVVTTMSRVRMGQHPQRGLPAAAVVATVVFVLRLPVAGPRGEPVKAVILANVEAPATSVL